MKTNFWIRVQYVRSAFGRDISSWTISTNLGWAYASVGRESDAIGVLRQAAAHDDVEALNNRGSILARTGQWSEALRVLERAHEGDPDDPNVESNLGWVYANLGRLDEARQHSGRWPNTNGSLDLDVVVTI